MSTIASDTSLQNHKIVSEQEWLSARRELLEKEKEWTRAKDELSRLRRGLPWVKVEKNYIFEGPNGPESLANLFGKHSQLIVYHFMYAPEWDEGCEGCSYISDHFDGALWHLPRLNVSFAAVSRAPLAKLEAYKNRMGWRFKWVSSMTSDFNYDYGATYRREDLDSGPVMHNFSMQILNSEEQPGISVFYKDEGGTIFHTYSTYERGADIMLGTYNFADMTPKGRDAEAPGGRLRRHDEYGSN